MEFSWDEDFQTTVANVKVSESLESASKSSKSPQRHIKVKTEINKGPCLPCKGNFCNALQRARCKFHRCKDKWEKELLVDPDEPGLGSWLTEENPGNGRDHWGAGCLICKAPTASKKSQWAKCTVRTTAFLQIQNLRVHGHSTNHKDALAKVFGGTSSVDARLSPSMQEFKDVLSMRSVPGNSLRSADIEGMERKKIPRLMFCLAEAHRRLEREFLLKAASIVLHQDARAGRLLIRYSACSTDLQVMKGCLGHDRGFGSTAEDVCRAVERVLRKFCTKNNEGVGVLADRTKLLFSQELHDIIRQKVEILDADAAADEQLAGRTLRKTSLVSAAEGLFPNVKVCIKDPSHGSRRPVEVKNVAVLIGVTQVYTLITT